MSISYDLTKIENYGDLYVLETNDDGQPTGQARMNPITHAITRYVCMVIGMGEITEANVGEFWARVYAAEKVYGAFLQDVENDAIVDHPLTYADIKRHIGLRTNVFPQESRTKFMNRLHKRIEEDAAEAAKISEAAES